MNKLISLSIICLFFLKPVYAEEDSFSEKSWSIKMSQNGDEPIQVESERIERNKDSIVLHKKNKGTIDKNGLYKECIDNENINDNDFFNEENYQDKERDKNKNEYPNRRHSCEIFHNETNDEYYPCKTRKMPHRKKHYGWFTEQPGNLTDRQEQPVYETTGAQQDMKRKVQDRSRIQSINDFFGWPFIRRNRDQENRHLERRDFHNNSTRRHEKTPGYKDFEEYRKNYEELHKRFEKQLDDITQNEEFKQNKTLFAKSNLSPDITNSMDNEMQSVASYNQGYFDDSGKDFPSRVIIRTYPKI